MGNDICLAVGARIKEMRIARGLSQRSLAEMINVTKGAIGNYENGTSSPRDTILIALMKALDIDANFLFQDVVPIKPSMSLTPPETALIKKYRALDGRGRRAVDAAADNEYSQTGGRGSGSNDYGARAFIISDAEIGDIAKADAKEIVKNNGKIKAMG